MGKSAFGILRNSLCIANLVTALFLAMGSSIVIIMSLGPAVEDVGEYRGVSHLIERIAATTLWPFLAAGAIFIIVSVSLFRRIDVGRKAASFIAASGFLSCACYGLYLMYDGSRRGSEFLAMIACVTTILSGCCAFLYLLLSGEHVRREFRSEKLLL
jgi:hypothetical protein